MIIPESTLESLESMGVSGRDWHHGRDPVILPCEMRRSVVLACAAVMAATPSYGPQVQEHELLALAQGQKVIHIVATPDLAHWASISTHDDVGPGTGGDAQAKKGPRLVHHDGIQVGAFPHVPAASLTLSPDGTRLAFASVSWGKNDFARFVVHLDGEPAGEAGHYSPEMELGAGLGPWFSADGAHLAWPWLWKGRWCVMVDGKCPAGDGFDRVRLDHPWTPDNRLVAVVGKEATESLLVDGIVQATAQGIRRLVGASAASQPPAWLAWVEQSEPGERLVAGGTKGPWFARVGQVTASQDGSSWAHTATDQAGRDVLVADGKTVATHDSVRDPAFDALGRLSFVERTNGRERLHVAGSTSPDFWRIELHAFLPAPGGAALVGRDGSRCQVLLLDPATGQWSEEGSYMQVYRIVPGPAGHVALSVLETGRAAVVLDKALQGPWAQQVRHCSVTFSPDGAHLAHAATVDGQDLLVLDGQVVGAWDRIHCPLVFSQQGLSFIALGKSGIVRVDVRPG